MQELKNKKKLFLSTAKDFYYTIPIKLHFLKLKTVFGSL